MLAFYDQATIPECVVYSTASFAPHLLPACTGRMPVATFQMSNRRQHLQLEVLQYHLWESSWMGTVCTQLPTGLGKCTGRRAVPMSMAVAQAQPALVSNKPFAGMCIANLSGNSLQKFPRQSGAPSNAQFCGIFLGLCRTPVDAGAIA